MASAKATEFLTKQLSIQKDIVTFRWLSRELGIHVNEAKNYLAAFYASSQASGEPVHATFLLTGNAAPSKGEDDKMDVDENPTETVAIRKIMLVGEDELESAKSQFTQPPSMHVYSLSPTAIKDAALLTTASERVRLKDVTQGKAFNQTVGIVVGSDVRIGSSKPASTKTAKLQPVATSSTFTKEKEKAGVVEKSKPVEKPKREEKKKAGTLDWSKAKPKADKLMEGSKMTETIKPDSNVNSKPSAKKDDSKIKDIPKVVKETAPRKIEDTKRGNKRSSNVMLSDSEDEAPSPKTKQRLSKGRKNAVASDDEDGEPAKDTQFSKKGKGRVILSDDEDGAPLSLKAMMDLDDTQVTPRQSKQEAEAEEEGDIEMQDEDEDDDVPVVKRKVKRKPKKVIPLGKNGLPKRRVVKSRKTKNAKGYTVTEDYSSYESISESEQAPPEEGEAGSKKKVKQDETTKRNDKDSVKSERRESRESSSKGAGKKGKDLMGYFKKK